MSIIPPFLLLFIAWFSGSLPFGYWAGRLKGLDIRQHGSGNIGTTNVFRVLGKGMGLVVFLLDFLKGAVPVWLAIAYYNQIALDPATPVELHSSILSWKSWTSVLCVAAAVLGHSFTFWLKFKGGKGVATSAGALMALTPLPLTIAFLSWGLVLYLSRYVSLASIIAGLVLPIAAALHMHYLDEWNFVVLGLDVLLALLVVIRHRSNIERLMNGTESRVGSGKNKSS